MVNYRSYFEYEQYENPGEPPRAQILRCKKSLKGMRDLILFQVSQVDITRDTINTLERELSEIIGRIDTLRSASNLDALLSSVDGVLTSIRNARKCLNIASGLVGKAHSASALKSLYDNFEEFTDLLLDALQLFKV